MSVGLIIEIVRDMTSHFIKRQCWQSLHYRCSIHCDVKTSERFPLPWPFLWEIDLLLVDYLVLIRKRWWTNSRLAVSSKWIYVWLAANNDFDRSRTDSPVIFLSYDRAYIIWYISLLNAMSHPPDVIRNHCCLAAGFMYNAPSTRYFLAFDG